MVREETKSYLGSKNTITVRVAVPKRIFKLNETFDMEIQVENYAGKKIPCARVYVLKIETTMMVHNTSNGIERKVTEISWKITLSPEANCVKLVPKTYLD